jgi:hypothetical protein
VKILRFAPLFLLLSACLSLQSEEQQAEAAEKALLARHDELMAQMDDLYALRQQVQQLPDTVRVARLQAALLGAEAGMMFWMHHYRRPADTTAVTRRLAYYAAQQQRIDSVGQLFRSSQDSARQAASSISPSRSQ